MKGTVIYETKAKWRPYLIVTDGTVSFDKFDPYAEYVDGEVHMVYFQSDPIKEKILIDAITERMAEIGVVPGDETKTVSFTRDGFPVFVGKTIENFINGSLRHYAYSHWIHSFEDLINVIKYKIPKNSFVCKPESYWNPKDFVLTVNRPIYRRVEGNKKRNTFDFIDIEMVIRSTDVDKRKVIENKEEIFNKAIARLETSKQFQNYGVPVNFLKMYQFVLRKDGTLLISFCLKQPVEFKESEEV